MVQFWTDYCPPPPPPPPPTHTHYHHLPLPPFSPLHPVCSMTDSFQSWFMIAHLHVWFFMVRLKREGKDGEYLIRQVVATFWHDVEHRMRAMEVRGGTCTLWVQHLGKGNSEQWMPLYVLTVCVSFYFEIEDIFQYCSPPCPLRCTSSQRLAAYAKLSQY